MSILETFQGLVGSLSLQEQQLWLPNQQVHDPDSWTTPHLLKLKMEYEVLVNKDGWRVQEMYTVGWETVVHLVLMSMYISNGKTDVWALLVKVNGTRSCVLVPFIICCVWKTNGRLLNVCLSRSPIFHHLLRKIVSRRWHNRSRIPRLRSLLISLINLVKDIERR
jgi:hypothetical protein